MSHTAYIKRLINLALSGCKDTSEDLKIFYVEHNLFGDKNEFEKDENSNSTVVIEKLETITNFSKDARLPENLQRAMAAEAEAAREARAKVG